MRNAITAKDLNELKLQLDQFPPILSPAQFGKLLGVSRKAVYAWIKAGHLKGAQRKRGKHHLIVRDKALDLIFLGPDWSH